MMNKNNHQRESKKELNAILKTASGPVLILGFVLNAGFFLFMVALATILAIPIIEDNTTPTIIQILFLMLEFFCVSDSIASMHKYWNAYANRFVFKTQYRLVTRATKNKKQNKKRK